MAGFLARGSLPSTTFPGTDQSPVVFMAVGSPLTVAGAAAELHAGSLPELAHRIPLVSPCGHHHRNSCTWHSRRQQSRFDQHGSCATFPDTSSERAFSMLMGGR